MTGDKPHILFHRSTPWHSAVECSTKTYAKRFRAAGYQVTYLQDIANIGHVLTRKGYFDTWKRGCRWQEGIWIATSCSWLPRLAGPGRVLDASLDLSYRLCSPSLQNTMKRSGQGQPDVIWTTAPGSSALKRLFPRAKLIFHVVDYYPAFRGEHIKRIERRDYENSDCIFSIGEALTNYLHDELAVPFEKIVTLGQGAPVEEYSRRWEIPADIEFLPRPMAIYVGVLKKLDRGLLESAAAALASEGGCLVLIGPDVEWLDVVIRKCPNIHYLGTRSSQEVPAYLQNADVGLMLYDREKAPVYLGQNPLKLYEYAAARLPVISTPHKEFQFIKPPVWIVESENDVMNALQKLSNEGAKVAEEMGEFAERYSWKNCVETANCVIRTLLPYEG